VDVMVVMVCPVKCVSTGQWSNGRDGLLELTV